MQKKRGENGYKNDGSEERAIALFAARLKGVVIIAEGPEFRSFFRVFCGVFCDRKGAGKQPKITQKDGG